MCTALTVGIHACRVGESEREALERLQNARARLAVLAPDAKTGFSADAVSIARDSLLGAERAIRRGRETDWEPKLHQALETVDIATWVVARQREGARADAESRIDLANATIQSVQSSSEWADHRASRSQLRRAQAALGAAVDLFEAGAFQGAADNAQTAIGLANELPEELRLMRARYEDPDNQLRWTRWTDQALGEASRTHRAAFIVDKRAQTAMLWEPGQPVRWFRVELGYEGLSRKLESGDGATPEGLYRVIRKKSRGETKYYKALLLNYPNDDDRARFRRAKTEGRVGADAAIGGLIEIHGDGGRGSNWTDGCVALTNEEMDLVFSRLAVGSPVAIVGNYGGTSGP